MTHAGRQPFVGSKGRGNDWVDEFAECIWVRLVRIGRSMSDHLRMLRSP